MSQQRLKPGIKISRLWQERTAVAFSYNPNFVQKVKTIQGYKWHPEKKYWSFPNANETLGRVLKVFEGEEIHIDSALQSKFLKKPDSHCEAKPKQSHFEDLRRELLSRKYSYNWDKRNRFVYNPDFNGIYEPITLVNKLYEIAV